MVTLKLSKRTIGMGRKSLLTTVLKRFYIASFSQISIRACLKKVFCEMCIAVTVIFMTSSICYFASGAQLAEQGLSKPGLKA